ncbi:hypothetical protein CDCA_CDCA11G3245 [Cyanidium caldarium]|uniref:Aluminum resistance family protein n=1 Tax=Cyanidium caldarium TaxID=2771 RepID=A0AAV9IYQ0_CYACA|nr:hypothetical protein CDCA_CDCA11G3245 [Cyanidium caldarium]
MAAQERQLPGWVLPTAGWQRCLRGRLALRPERRLVRTPRRRARRPRHAEIHTPLSLSLSSDARARHIVNAPALDADSVVDDAIRQVYPTFLDIDRRTEHNLRRVLQAFRKHRVGQHHFAGVNGYGHGDLGRDTLDAVYADIFGTEAALVRAQFFSGTHAIAACLFGVLRPGDELLAVAGAPYDTLEEVIGTRSSSNGAGGSLADFGIAYRQLELVPPRIGQLDWRALEDGSALAPNTRLCLLQRSRGYALRPSLSVAEVAAAARLIKRHRPDVVVMVDNCYGEFVEDVEPTGICEEVDFMAGSLIKNPGGTLALGGGYVVGRAPLVAAAANRLSAPGVHGGATYNLNRTNYQGLFMAPQIVGEALKGATLVAQVMHELGFEVSPAAGGTAHRTDIIQAVRLGSAERVLEFARAVQRHSAVGSYIQPTAGATPGYADPVVFADGTFMDGSTLELSADGPLREPYVVYAQGGTHWTHWAMVLRDFCARATVHRPEEVAAAAIP